MTLDELDRQIIAIKKQGLTPYVERHKIGQVRQKYYMEKIHSEKENITDLLIRNIAFLSKIHNIKCNRYTLDQSMGILPDDFFDLLMEGKTLIYNFEHILLCASFFGISPELLLFTDLQANEQTIRNEYPSVFKQSRY